MIYNLDENNYKVEIIKKSNKNTYIRIKNDLIIQVTTNFFTTKNQIKDLLDRNQNFLRKTINKKEESNKKEEKFYFLGKEFDIIIAPTFDNIEVDNNKIYVSDKREIDLWLKKQTLQIFEERLKYNYDLFSENIPYPKLRVRVMKTRWGVCNRKNLTVTINSLLIRYDVEKIDYVIIHELSHLVHFNHSTAFWNTVSKYCPKYKQIRKELRE